MTWQQLSAHELAVYSTTWCPDCRRFKKHLDASGFTYSEIDIDADPEAARRLQESTGRTAIPYIEVDGKVMVRGWHDEKPGKWDEQTFLAEVEAALSGA